LRARTTGLLALATAFALGASAPGCANFSLFGSGGPSFASTAKANYDKGLVELKKKNWLDAIKLFQYVKTKYSFSKYATLAELGIADADLGRERYAEAIDGYRNFIKAHPSHERVTDGYAAFRVGETFHKEIPSEWFLVPPAYEKDQGPVRDALRELSAFLAEYPDSPYVAAAKKLEEDCVRRLADHELYVAEFYLKKKKPVAAAHRLEGLVSGEFLPKLPGENPDAAGRLGQVAKEYLKTHLEAQVMLQLARTQRAAGTLDEAQKTAERIVAEHGSEPQAKKAKSLLEDIARDRLAQKK
jgi:outer membrane protein assembly factor BamD